VNDLELSTNPQELLLSLFMGRDIGKDHPLVRYCTSCYRCAHACPWGIRIPEVVRALRETLGLESPFEKAFKDSLRIWGRVYEPYVILRTIPFLIKEGYVKYLPKWTDYIGFHLPRTVKGK
jgi:Fe-S oxidoreductase